MAKSVAEVRDDLAKAGAKILAMKLSLSATIADYPIGGNHRGQCRLEVERKKGKGYRPVKTTTNRSGQWCKPHKGVYRDGPMCVCDCSYGDERSCWVSVSERGVWLEYANGDKKALAEAPHYCRPNREDQHYTLESHDMLTNQLVDSKKYCTPADPPEVCDAYDAWLEGLKEIRRLVLMVWGQAEIQKGSDA